jgi:CRP/FNR family transcriptional regulator, cyclic AMP receptor protein
VTSVATHTSVGTCRVLERESMLGEAIPEERRADARSLFTALELSVTPGTWAPAALGRKAGLGILVLRGSLLRRVGVGGRFAAELLGPGDLLRPWQGDEDPPTLPVTSAWRVLEPTRLAVLDERFAASLPDYPELMSSLIGRGVQRSRNLAVNMAIVHQPRVDVRVHMLLWHLASRWGVVSARGVRVPLRLTHALLAELAAARRPTVTTALSELSRRGLVAAEDEGWLLSGNPPGELMELGGSAPARLQDVEARRAQSG